MFILNQIMKLKNILFALLIFAVTVLSAQDTRFRLAVNGGPGYRISKIQEDASEEIKNYLRELKSGFTIDVEANYMIRPSWGLGVQYSNFSSKGSTTALFSDEFGEFFRLPTTDNISITYIGPQYITKNSTSDGLHSLMGSLSFGYLGYKNAASVNGVPVTFKAETIGFGIGIGYEYRIAQNIGIGAKFGVVGGSVSEYEVTANGTTQTLSAQSVIGLEREGLTRIDVLGGIRFYL